MTTTLPRRYRKKLKKYKDFVDHDWPLAKLDWSEEAAIAVFMWESKGQQRPPENNGYRVGKQWWDWQVEHWRDEMTKALLFPFELREDQSLADCQKEAEAAIAGSWWGGNRDD